ncbi:sugar phosphate isomerase/epimerase family protein [Planctomicrobium piriforme]|uniref:Sugar phosphate isomerase/epimerase n=1 Tax=Planctomicrobium piriforme TaxID=1576369 RepID=A0A1I3EPS3_9PLAN|nr:sugar phosphate isomerase/epimerase [Planctomicrobium piriforme]SFI01006.1 Sugar phosphate isomerase/epimerase [Planctomicrobium piriforme]
MTVDGSVRNLSQASNGQQLPSAAFSRRAFCATLAAAAVSGSFLKAADQAKFNLKYLVGSSMYGETPIAEILPQVAKTGSSAIDIWPRVHGNQREQLDEMGEEAFAALLKKENVQLGCITQYKLGPFKLKEELKLAQRLGCKTIVTEGVGPKGLSGDALKSAIAKFIEQMQPHLELAREAGVVIAIENHGNGLMESPDSVKWLVELEPSTTLGIALAPYHLPQEEKLLAELIRTIGNRMAVFYGWQHGNGCMKKLPKEEELLQMPGRGPLDFTPLLQAMKDIQYSGWTEIFMHPTPRGIPIMESTAAVTAEINKSRAYFDQCLVKLM